MELTLSILMDELSNLHPIVQKSLSSKISFEQIRYYNAQDHETNAAFLYLGDSTIIGVDFSQYCPNHLLILNNDIPTACLNHAETVIQVTASLKIHELYQQIMDIFMTYENWNQSMLLAIIHHKSIEEFLEIASKKLMNPVAFNDNNMSMIAKAGQFTKPYSGTVWEVLEAFGHVKSEFFTVQEHREITKMLLTTRDPLVYHPTIDKTHTYATSQVWVGDKQYGSLGIVDINAPFTDGQLSIIKHITENIKLYIQNNEAYMRVAENEVTFINSLLKGIPINENIIAYHLAKQNWVIHDQFYLLSFACPVPLDSPIQSLSYLKRIDKCFPESFITVYNNTIIMIIRDRDYSIKNQDVKQNLDKLLTSNEMKCGVSACFPDFSQLKYYYIQSCFAIEYCNQYPEIIIQHYEYCYKEHIIQVLRTSTDLSCFCQPRILAMWNSQEENQKELIHCLYHYLINGRNLTLTSEALYIHRNTLIYRINKLSRILELDLKNLSSDQLFYLLFSCMLVEHL